jgi:phage terminase large subunit
MQAAQIALPPKLKPVFIGPADVRGAYGGRGSAKTRSFAKMAAVWGYRFGMEGVSGIILCARQFMNSLDDSSLEEVKRAIQEEPFLADYYEIGERYIKSKDGRISFAFAGLDRSIASIKSKGRILLCWVDEAEPVAEAGWSILVPTLREEGTGWNAELWVTWNPARKGAPVESRFRGSSDPRIKVVELNWRDNPRFPATLDRARLRDQSQRPEQYAHIWEGGYDERPGSLVFRNWKVETFERPPGTIHRLGADWGFSIDPSVMVRCDIEGNRLYVDWESWALGCEIVNLPELFMVIPEAEKWPSTADSARPETISHMNRHGFPKMRAAIKGPKSLEEGVSFLQSFDIVVHPRCVHVIEELTLYRYKTDPLTGEILPILEDKNNHCIDALRYACEGARRAGKAPKPPSQPKPIHSSPQGWMSH